MPISFTFNGAPPTSPTSLSPAERNAIVDAWKARTNAGSTLGAQLTAAAAGGGGGGGSGPAISVSQSVVKGGS